MAKKTSKKAVKSFKPLDPDLWAPMSKEEKARAKNLRPFGKAFVKALKSEREED